MNNERIKKIGYWRLVWTQFKKNRIALFGLCVIILLALLAVYAPFISSNKPIYVTGLEDKTLYPFLSSLFDRNVYENSIDLFFNTVMVLSPFLLIAYLICSISGANRRRTLLYLMGLTLLINIIVLAIPYSSQYRNFPQEIEAAKSEGKEVKALFPLKPYLYREIDTKEDHPLPPSKKHFFGTDPQGRDVFARIIFGIRISLTIGVVAVAIYMTIGIIIGAIAGYFGGWVDLIAVRFIEIMLCFPVFFLILTIAAFIENRSIFHIMIIIGLTNWTTPARLIRGEYLKHRSLDYVNSSIMQGFKKKKIIFKDILPNAIAPVLVTATFGIASAIVTEASLSFLGLGDPTVPSWGEILTVGRIQRLNHLILIPGFAIFLVVSVFNLVGEGLRDALDPKLRK